MIINAGRTVVEHKGPPSALSSLKNERDIGTHYFFCPTYESQLFLIGNNTLNGGVCVDVRNFDDMKLEVEGISWRKRKIEGRGL